MDEVEKVLPSAESVFRQNMVYPAHGTMMSDYAVTEPLAKRKRLSPEVTHSGTFGQRYTPPIFVPPQSYPYSFPVPLVKPPYVPQQPVPNYINFGTLPGDPLFLSQPHLGFRN